MRGDVGVGHRDLVAERVGGERDDLRASTFSFRCLYSRSSSASETAIQSVSAARSRSSTMLATQAFLELGDGQRRVLRLEYLPIRSSRR